MEDSKNKKCIVCGDVFHSRISGYDGELKGEMLCNKHLLQVKRNGKILDPTKSRRREVRVCDICGDNNKIRQFGNDGLYDGYLLCQKHYSQARDYNEITDSSSSQKNTERICSVCKSDDRVIYYPKYQKMFCRRHYDHMYIYGKILTRTVFDRNEIIILDDIAEVVIYNGRNEEINRVLIDTYKIDTIKDYKWSINSWDYACTKINGESFSMQDMIYGSVKRGEIVDHIDRNRIDNRMRNLRISNKSTNSMNTGLRVSNSSGVTGVSYMEDKNKWRSYISYEKKRYELGWFEVFEDAVRARLIAESEHHKEFAAQRHLFEEYGVQ